tara:strand:- start:257 stop:781 length:525 start_codon:yes stop_codon:yes gene_type:complete
LGQEFIIKSQNLEDKVNQLLPSQGGFQAGVDLSASTMVVPIVDLTESAEGSSLRVDLQSAISFSTATAFNVVNTTSTIINTTGYWKISGSCTLVSNSGGPEENQIIINDGTTDKIVWQSRTANIGVVEQSTTILDLVVFLPAGHSLKMTSSNISNFLSGSVRQLADINGNLINP